MARLLVKRVRVAFVVLLALGVAAAACSPRPRHRARAKPVLADRPAPPSSYPVFVPWGDHSVQTRLTEIGPRARRRWSGYFQSAGVGYPAASVVMLVLKRERQVEVYAGPSPYQLAYIRNIAITAASGGPGPKLREGDRQVPEGIYEVVSLNPNSAYHVSMRLDYPNDFDRRMAKRDRRHHLGSAIMIHGSDRSIGCVAVGDEAAEDLFVITADAGLGGVSVVIVPRDFRRTGEHEVTLDQPAWVHELYATLDLKLRSLPARATTRGGRVDASLGAR